MKILICTQEYYPKGSGIANVVYYIAEELKKIGYSITVLSTSGGDIRFEEFEKKISKWGGIALIWFWEKVRKYIKKHYDDYDVFWVHNPLFIRKIKPDKIYSTVHTTYKGYSKVYMNFTCSWYIKLYYKMMKVVEKFCYWRNKFRTSCVSPVLIKELSSLGIKNAIYVPNGVDTVKFKPSTKKYKVSLPAESKIVLCVGRVTYPKCPFKLIETFAEIEKLNKNIHLVWAGSGELFEDAKNLIKKLGCKNVHLLGNVPHEKLSSLFASASAYILASCYEGQPLTVLEALSTGTPCILSNIPNLVHIIKASRTGIVVDFDKNDRAKKIANYLEKTDLKKESEKARKFAVNNLDWSIIVKKYNAWWKSEKK